jgi:hypothetical protein
MDEEKVKAQLDQILRKYMPNVDDRRRRSLIDAVPLYLWSIYGWRSV